MSQSRRPHFSAAWVSGPPPHASDTSRLRVPRKRIAILGATGAVGRLVIDRALARGHAVTAQTRDPEKLSDVFDRVRVMKFPPWSANRMPDFLYGQDVVLFALGLDHGGATTLFSESTRVLIAAMRAQRVPRLIAITGVGAGDSRGHGGIFHDWLIHPLFTRQRYLDKNRQEVLIRESDLDWTILRPARFVASAATSPLRALTRIEADTVLRQVTREEVADFVIAEIDAGAHRRQCVFLGHN